MPLLVDFWSEHNRGDAMMQNTLKDIFTQYDVPTNIILDSGINEYQKFAQEVDCSSQYGAKNPNYLPSCKFSCYFRKPGKIANILNKTILIANPLVLPVFVLLYKIKLLPKSLSCARSLRAIDEASSVVWNGRNFRTNRPLFEPFELYDLCLNAIVAIMFKKPCYAYGISIWPLTTVFGRWFMRKVLGSCKTVYCRETSSFGYCRDVLKITNIALFPDLSFYYMKQLLSYEDASHTKVDGVYRIGVVPKDPVSRNGIDIDEYVDYIEKTARYILSQAGNAGVEFAYINQAVINNEDCSLSTQRLTEKLSKLGTVIPDQGRNPSIESIFHSYSKCDFLISSRMHACISCAYLGIPFIGIPYDSGAKWQILNDIGDAALTPMENIPTLEQADYVDLYKRATSYNASKTMQSRALDVLHAAKEF